MKKRWIKRAQSIMTSYCRVLGTHILSILVLTLCFTSCCEKKEETFGLIDESNINTISIIDINTFKDYPELLSVIDSLACQKRIPAIKIHSKNGNKLVALHAPCWEETSCFHIKRRNRLLIKNDSIHADHQIAPIDWINIYLKKHYLNEGCSEVYSEHPSKAIITIIYENHSIHNLEKVIDKITDAFLKLELEEIPLLIMLDRPRTPVPARYSGYCIG